MSYQLLNAERYSLTPRTPHSRSGRFEDIDITDIDLDGQYSSQDEPLLGSQAQESDEIKKDYNTTPWILRAPLALATALVILLLLLVGVSIQRPAILQHKPPAEQAATIASEEPFQLPADFSIISYENYTTFPLNPSQYRDECQKITPAFMQVNLGYWAPAKSDVLHRPVSDRTCTSTVTYMLGGGVGLLADLALMAQAAAFARERNRTFWVDDTYWNRGKWSDYFEDVRDLQPGPEPGCTAPPSNELAACPRSARHWVVNSKTAKFHFTHMFFEEYENPYARGINRLKPIYNNARASFSGVFQPKAELSDLIREARTEFDATEYVSVHIRQGDRLGMSWAYHNSHIPIQKYIDVTKATWERLNSAGDEPVVYLASDSPSSQGEFMDSFSTGARIYSLAQSQNAGLRALASPSAYFQEQFDKMAEGDMVRLTKGMVVDFALLSGLWNNGPQPLATVCGISSNICKMSALGFGWDGAFGDLEDSIDEERKRWVEIDNAGAIAPAWEAFEVFP